ncbi:MAG: redox-regulated ATPase YchF [Candidatus Dependentiae bacterium]|jgi:GTP-binding protein YchF
MALYAGLVGLPNVGKSTLFNALTKSSIPSENYPFCTIDPHTAITNVPDARLEKLATIFDSQKIIPATMQFVDIAGLVKGAAEGEGLGNQFLSNVMGVDLILHVLRCFDDPDITHVHERVNPLEDFEIIMAELCLKDLESLEKRLTKMESVLKKIKHSGTAQELKDATAEHQLLLRLQPLLENGDVDGVRTAMLESGNKNVQLLTAKNFLIVANVSEDEFSGNAYENNDHYKALVAKFGAQRVIPVSAKIEAELAQMDDADAQEMMDDLEITQTGLNTIIAKTYANLGLISFYTCGPKEAHAWSIKAGTKAPQAAGTIHSDLERGFICSETYHCDDLFEVGTEAALKQSGKMRTEGKEYVIADGDVIHVRFNV